MRGSAGGVPTHTDEARTHTAPARSNHPPDRIHPG
mgnify:CR=1